MPKTLKRTRLDSRQDDCPLTLSLGFPCSHPRRNVHLVLWQVHWGRDSQRCWAWSGRGRLLRQHVTKTGRSDGVEWVGWGGGGGGGKATKVVATHSLRWVKSQALDGGSP